MTTTLYLHVDRHVTSFSVQSDDAVSQYEIPVGAITLTTDELVSNPPRAEELSNAISVVQAYLDDVLRELPLVSSCEDAVGSGPVIETMAAVEVGDPNRAVDQTGFVLSRDAAEDVYRTLATESAADRRHNPGLPADEVDWIVGGCCIVVAVMRRLYLGAMTIAAVSARAPDMRPPDDGAR